MTVDDHHINSARGVLREFWGYESFRPWQEEIITSAIGGSDTIALLPTGGGKSICYQVPALMQQGICLVISPLIALMEDQVRALRNRGIEAVLVHGGMHSRDIDRILDNCVYGNIKFLYLSPERLKQPITEARIRRMKVNLVAIDEAHCISQWGHDFRPAYLEIAVLREWQPDVPLLALTATATEEVIRDIQCHLQLHGPALFKGSFSRTNLSYLVHHTESKLEYMLGYLRRNTGAAIVYVRSRRKANELAALLRQHNVDCLAFHAGMSVRERATVQAQWLSGMTPVIAATTAFGMGIDKSNVRVVVHYDLPGSMEEFYQEAGRAGRDGAPAWCTVLFHDQDLAELAERAQSSYPPAKQVYRVYSGLMRTYHLPLSERELASFPFDLERVHKATGVSRFTLTRALDILEKSNWIRFDALGQASPKVQVVADGAQLASYRQDEPANAELLAQLLRLHEGIRHVMTPISLSGLVEYTQQSEKVIVARMQQMVSHRMVRFEPAAKNGLIHFLHPEVELVNVKFDEAALGKLRDLVVSKASAVHRFVKQSTCRERFVLAYFGEASNEQCGRCDWCRSKQKRPSRDALLDHIREKNPSIHHLLEHFGYTHKKQIVQTLSDMERSGLITLRGQVIKMASSKR